MNRTTRFASAALAAALTFGAAGPAVAAGNPDRPAHSATKPDKPAKVETKHLKQALKDIANLDKRLAKVVKESRISRITEADKAAVVANVAADRVVLAELAATTRTADSNTDLKQVRRDLKNVRVQNYAQVINDLRFAARLAIMIEDEREYVEAGSVEAAALDEAAALLAAAVEKAHATTAASDKTALRAVKGDLIGAKSLYEAAFDSDDSDDEIEDEDETEDDSTL